MAENERLSFAPVLVVDLRAVLGGDRVHGFSSRVEGVSTAAGVSSLRDSSASVVVHPRRDTGLLDHALTGYLVAHTTILSGYCHSDHLLSSAFIRWWRWVSIWLRVSSSSDGLSNSSLSSAP